MNLKFKECFVLITYTGILFLVLNNLSWISNLIFNFFYILTPFIYGFVIAYIVSVPYEFFKQKLFWAKFKKYKHGIKLTNILSFTLSYIIVLGLIVFAIGIIVPHLIVSFTQLANNIPKYVDALPDLTSSLNQKFKLNFLSPESEQNIAKKFLDSINSTADVILPSIFNFTKNFAFGIYNFVLGLIISFYFVCTKDKLLHQVKLVSSVILPKKLFQYSIKIIKISNEAFGKFIIAKSIDAFIIGVLCFIGMKILSIPYDLLISVLIGITNLIPFFGPFMGAIPSILILLLIDPIKAIWFSIFILVLQQVDGNIIGPRILGNSIGISGIWIMFSVIVSGGLFGVIGMIIGVPAFTVVYTLIAEKVYQKHLEKLAKT